MSAQIAQRVDQGLGQLALPGPGGLTLGQLALRHPRAAFALLGGRAAPLLPDGCLLDVERLLCAWGWEIFDLKACFAVGDCGKLVTAKLCLSTGDVLVRKVVTTVERPNAFAGNIFKAQSDHFNSLNPNIHVQLEIDSWCKYVISSDFTPLQNLPIAFECCCPQPFVLTCNATIIGRFINRRVFFPGELPTEAIISFHVIRLPVPLDACTYTESLAALTRFGVIAGPPQLEQPPAGEPLRGLPSPGGF